MALLGSLTDTERANYDKVSCLFYHPFDPVDKWTYGKILLEDGRIVHAAKGAPQVILDRSNVNQRRIRSKVEKSINDLAKRGYRSIGVAVSDSQGADWRMIGLIPLFDPPRHDTKETIERTLELGVGVKMITGDQWAIAVETAHMLGMSGNIIPASALKMSKKRLESVYARDRAGLVEWADGFAQVLPEDKFLIVESLQSDHGLIVGMTGDGVNDAPALKKADIGIAVADATDAARGAADIVLTQPGLSVIVSAIICSRCIFQRMKSYTTYSVCAALRVVLTFTLLTVIFDFYFPTIAVVFFAILNDGTMITLARDRAKPSENPEKWNLITLFVVSITLGLYLTLSTIVFYYLIVYTTFWNHFALPEIGGDPESIVGVIYLQVSISGLAVVFSTRCHKWMWSHRPAWILIIAFIVCQSIASVLGAYGLNNYKGFGGAGWGWVLATWIWCIIWFIPVDFIKRAMTFLSKMRIRRTKEYRVIPWIITFKSHQEDVVDTQRKSFDDTRRSLSGGDLSATISGPKRSLPILNEDQTLEEDTPTPPPISPAAAAVARRQPSIEMTETTHDDEEPVSMIDTSATHGRMESFETEQEGTEMVDYYTEEEDGDEETEDEDECIPMPPDLDTHQSNISPHRYLGGETGSSDEESEFRERRYGGEFQRLDSDSEPDLEFGSPQS
jgi:magnesium-transporting ATPase (P-type)